MKPLTRVLPLAMILVLMLVGTAQAQTRTPPSGGTVAPKPGGSTNAPPVQPGATAPLDLPIEKPIPKPPPEPPKEPDDPNGEDPGDPIGEDPPTIYGEELPASDSIFYVIDISGSMNWDRSSYVGLDGNTTSGTKLDRAKVELIRSITGLSDEFEFNIIAYDCSTRGWATEMQEANDRNKAAANGWISSLSANGATGTGPATALALSERDNQTVVLLTDGAPNCGANGTAGHRAMILGANSQGAKIHCFGIAADGQFRQFLVDVASATGGRYVDVP